jgi:hypothetical protein
MSGVVLLWICVFLLYFVDCATCVTDELRLPLL